MWYCQAPLESRTEGTACAGKGLLREEKKYVMHTSSKGWVKSTTNVKSSSCCWLGWGEKSKKVLLEAEEARGQEDAGAKLSMMRQG